ncbi:hypothetical protein RRG08_002307 [Elysia crispata]|uniref:Uncharacterized protein n=1 Tax=Elysia crispata TaxID=231223 RepID=A0AAE0ZBX4_9GAST|nr:hypothetical protein RRG08_002307 [Elysia crispata]
MCDVERSKPSPAAAPGSRDLLGEPGIEPVVVTSRKRWARNTETLPGSEQSQTLAPAALACEQTFSNCSNCAPITY